MTKEKLRNEIVKEMTRKFFITKEQLFIELVNNLMDIIDKHVEELHEEWNNDLPEFWSGNPDVI